MNIVELPQPTATKEMGHRITVPQSPPSQLACASLSLPLFVSSPVTNIWEKK
jgi:hypothetical protein